MVQDWIHSNYEQGLISVIIPCHNEEQFLPACLDSVTAQDYRPLEIIIVDNGSSDGTKEVIEGYKNVKKDGIVIDCLHQANQGAQEARNYGCIEAHGEFIQFLDADDILSPGKFSNQMSVFINNDDVDVVYGDAQYLIDFGGTAREGSIISMGPSSDIIESLLFGYWQPSFSYLTRRSAVQRCGPWDITIQVSQDFEYFLRMAIRGSRFFYKAGVTGFYRKHSFSTLSEQSASIRGKTRRRILAHSEHLLRKQGKFNEQRVLAIAENYRRIARQAYAKDIKCFESSLNDVLRLCPQYLPKKRRARFISSIIGFRNYERIAAFISHHIRQKGRAHW